MRILCLVNVVPYPLYGGVQLRVFHLLRRIARRHEVTIGCHAWDDETDFDNAAALTRKGLRTVPGLITDWSWKRHTLPAAGHLLHGYPPELAQYQSPVLHDLVRSERFDILQIEETLLTPYAKSLPPGAKTKTVLTFHNIHFVQGRRIAEIESGGARRLWARTNARLMRRYEPAIARRFHRSITASEPDRQLLLSGAPGLRVDMIPNGVDTSEMALLQKIPNESKPAILFLGTLSYRPCIDAAVQLVRAILPLLRRRIPGIQVWIVGREATPEVLALAGDGVFVESSVPDVRPYYERASVAVVPLRAGGGSRLKILEAMSLGRPVVSTTVGAEGIDVADGENILLADDDARFADAVVRAISDDALRHTLVRNARRLVEVQYDWEAIAAAQLGIYDELLATA